LNTDETAAFHAASGPVAELCRAMDARDFDAIAAQLAPDAIWTIVGRKDRYQFGGPQRKDEFVAGIKTSLPYFEQFSFDVLAWAKNGDTVFVEAQVRALGPGTASYSNRYIIRFTVRDGLIKEALEHYDPFEALAYVEQLAVKA
jgi:ketosteroid isomerase-like protein